MSAVAETRDDAALARALGVAEEAVAATRELDVVDLHLDTLIPARLWGYDPLRRHGGGAGTPRLFGHLDLPRLAEAGVDAAMWSVTTNVLRGARGRWRALQAGLERLQSLADRSEGGLRVVRSLAEYRRARRAGAHACLPAIQGGNALEGAPEGPASIPDRLVTRVTLVHLSNSVYGATSSPLSVGRRGLTGVGRRLVEQLDAERILVDLAHVDRPGFWDALDAHDPELPVVATHTGVCGVREHWRNLDDAQVRAVAASGGVVGIILAMPFLRRKDGPRGADMVLEHLEHVRRVGGEGAPALGTDYDGAILPPPGLRDGLAVPRLVQRMLDHRWPPRRIEAALGGNALRMLGAIRPD